MGGGWAEAEREKEGDTDCRIEIETETEKETESHRTCHDVAAHGQTQVRRTGRGA